MLEIISEDTLKISPVIPRWNDLRGEAKSIDQFFHTEGYRRKKRLPEKQNMNLDLSSLKKAVKSLKIAVSVAISAEQEEKSSEDLIKTLKAGVIQNFEFTFELSWKMIRRWIQINLSPEAAEPRTKKDLFRIAAQNGLIEDPQIWFQFHEARNLTAHTYDEENAETVYRQAVKFSSDADKLLTELEATND